MALIREDGTGVAGANVYSTDSDLEDYAEDRAITLATGDEAAALVRGTEAVEYLFGARLSGDRLNGRSQGLSFPRTGCTDGRGNEIAEDEIPVEWLHACFEAAIRELASHGSMMPDLKRGGAIKRVKAGEVDVEWFGNAPAATTFSKIEGLLAGLLGSSSGYTATAVRA